MIKNPTAYRSALRSAGYKATPQRLALLSVLEKASEPLSIQEILLRCHAQSIDQATIYRTLKTLADIGLVRQVDFAHAHAHFELATGDDHHHLICTSCGRVEDVTGCDFDRLAKRALKHSSFASIDRHSLEFFGTCRKC